MADSKITALASIGTGTDPANDPLVIVDVSDILPGGMSLTGTTKKVTLNNLLACSPTAGGNFTITGDLTVDTSTLKVDSANNRVGVLNTPTVPFEVTGLIASSSGSFQAGASNGIFAGLNNDGTNPGLDLRRWTGTANNHGAAYIATSSSGDALFYTDSVASNTRATSLRMTLNATGLGVGVASPAAKIHIANASMLIDTLSTQNKPSLLLGSAGANFGQIQNDGTGLWSLGYGATASALGTPVLSWNSSGNLGLGVTPSAWGAGYKAFDVGGGASVAGLSNQAFIVTNAYDNGGWLYKANAAATLYLSTAGQHRWYNAPSGTAGNAITFTQAMTLDASGNLLVGTTTANGRIAVDADLTTYNGVSVKNTAATYGSSILFQKFINSSGATAGSIQHTAVTTTNYNTASDARLKESKGVATDTSVIDNTVIHDFVWKADGLNDRGVFAQEAHSVKPTAISVGNDELTHDGNIKNPWSVDYSKYVPDLIVYCQQLKKQVVELSNRIVSLENK